MLEMPTLYCQYSMSRIITIICSIGTCTARVVTNDGPSQLLLYIFMARKRRQSLYLRTLDLLEETYMYYAAFENEFITDNFYIRFKTTFLHLRRMCSLSF